MIVLLLKYKTNKVSYLVGHFSSSLYFLHAMCSHFLKHLVKMDNWPERLENGRRPAIIYSAIPNKVLA